MRKQKGNKRLSLAGDIREDSGVRRLEEHGAVWGRGWGRVKVEGVAAGNSGAAGGADEGG